MSCFLFESVMFWEERNAASEESNKVSAEPSEDGGDFIEQGIGCDYLIWDCFIAFK